jgi:quinol-cytochrome oxidoreductase complex cytochrome b subunit/coenzyme F420-reducing hydrogenase delta subunit
MPAGAVSSSGSEGGSPPANAPLRALRAVEALFDRAFGAEDNPWRHLGALSFYLFWIIAASGIYVYAFFDTSVAGAYPSVEALTHGQWYLGGIMRSLHRYASDAFVVTMLLHLLKEFVTGRYQGFRWFSWITGVPLLWLAYASGIGGYWLVWDRLAQFSLIASMEWLDAIPLFGDPMVRNFITPERVNDRLFSLLIFLHIGIPLTLLLGMYVHIQRVSRADVMPPRALGWGTLLALLAASLVRPALSHAPADLGAVPQELQLDWFYLFVHALMYASSPAALWVVAALLTGVLLMLPLLRRARPAPVAEVSPANCNGCGRCFADCPYAAVIMQPHPDKTGHQLAQVLPDLCASCGICAGACPSSTPFRSVDELVTGIDMPQMPIGAVRAQLEAELAQLAGEVKLVVFGCDHGAALSAVAAPDTAAISLLCAGMLPPSFVEYAIRNGADGVLVTGCRQGDCAFRLGGRWIEQRLAGEREPHLRANVPRERVRVAWYGRADTSGLERELAEHRASVRLLGRDEVARHARAKRAKHRG